MYNNLESKLKVFAVLSFILGTIVSIVLGIAMFSTEGGAGTGIACIIAGPLASWIASLLPYGIGELLERTDDNSWKIEQINRQRSSEEVSPAVPHKAPSQSTVSKTWVCPKCHKTIAMSADACWNCGTKRDNG